MDNMGNMELIKIPLYCYDSEVDLDKCTILSFGSTKSTLKIVLRTPEGKPIAAYGVYWDLPKLSNEEKENRIRSCGSYVILGNQFIQGFSEFMSYQEVISPNPMGIISHLRNTTIIQNNTLSMYLPQEIVDIMRGKVQSLDSLSAPLGSRLQCVNSSLGELTQAVDNLHAFKSKDKEDKEINNSMANIFGNLKVGKAGSRYSITYFGTVAFNGKTYYNGVVYDAQGMTMPFDMLYLVPATEVKKGDVIEKNGKAYYVLDVAANKTVKAVDLESETEENLVAGGPFGMTMYSKLFNPMGNMTGDNAFGNIMMMQALTGDSCNKDNGMLMAMMMMQGGFKFPTFEMPKLESTEKK